MTVVKHGRRVRLRRPAVTRGPRPQRVHAPRTADLDGLAAAWERAFDSGDRALGAVGSAGAGVRLDVSSQRRALAHERHEVAELLERAARISDVDPPPWLSPIPLTNKSLALAPAISACLFDLDGVVTDSGVVHARAWAETFDELLLRLSEQTGWQFIPFDVDADYRDYLDGRPRLDGIHAFLASRGIHLPEGRVDDPVGANTAHALANRKSEAVDRGLRRRGVAALPGARRYLQAAGYLGLTRVVVSASTRTLPMLELAGLANLVDMRIDAELMQVEHLRARPATDLLDAACRHAGVAPAHAVTFTHSPAGIAAAHAAGLAAVGVGAGARAEELRGFGADDVVASLGSLLDRRLR